MADYDNGSNSWRIAVSKPTGGFAFIRAEDILKVWHVYQQGAIELYDVRIWLACHELVARRCRMNHKLKPSYRPGELAVLLGTGNDKRIRQSIRRLEQAGLLQWKTEFINLRTAEFPPETYPRYLWQEKLDLVQNWRRKVPVPRRVLRHLVSYRRKVLIAVVLGHLLRCVYYRNRKCISGGRCKASWLAEVFGVDVRNVKAARKELIRLGWIRTLPVGQRSLNRWGLPVIVNLNHSFLSLSLQAKSPPLQSSSGAKSPPLIMNRELSSRFENQKLRQGGLTGAQMGERKKKMPRLSKMRTDDLENPKRLETLFGQASKTGIISRAPADRLLWFAAAERALECGTRNPCGLFRAICGRKLWHYITQSQEDLARAKLKSLDYGCDISIDTSRYKTLQLRNE